MAIAKEKVKPSEVQPQAPMPARISPMIPRPATELPKDRENWISEVKWNGIRSVVYIDKEGRAIRVKTRQNNDISENFPELMPGFSHLARRHSLVLDGEIIYRHGKTNEERNMVVRRAGADPKKSALTALVAPCSYVAFDLLFLDGEDLREKPLLERKRKLGRLLPKNFQEKCNIVPSYFLESDPDVLYGVAERDWFEGIVLKRKDSRYLSGKRGGRWLKIKFRGHG